MDYVAPIVVCRDCKNKFQTLRLLHQAAGIYDSRNILNIG